jgi:CheY-like chemotaxis protein
VLRALGYKVLIATNGPAAMTILERGDYIDLLFTDVVMPGGMGGQQLAEKACALRPSLKVLFTSGYTENAILHHGRLAPGVHLIRKPYRKTDLALKLRHLLDAVTTDAA